MKDIFDDDYYLIMSQSIIFQLSRDGSSLVEPALSKD